MNWFKTKRRKLIGWLKKRAQGDSEDVVSVFKSISYAYGLYYGGWLLLVLAVLAILSFTSWLGGPFTAAQVIFFLIVGTVTIILLNLYVFWRTIKGKWESRNPDDYREARDVTETTSKDDAVREAHVIESSEKN
jgi:membrane protein implicated in regulation of membrane protease activity